MDSIRATIQAAARCYNVRLNFSPYSFTLMDFFITLLLLGIGLHFMMKLLRD